MKLLSAHIHAVAHTHPSTSFKPSLSKTQCSVTRAVVCFSQAWVPSLGLCWAAQRWFKGCTGVPSGPSLLAPPTSPSFHQPHGPIQSPEPLTYASDLWSQQTWLLPVPLEYSKENAQRNNWQGCPVLSDVPTPDTQAYAQDMESMPCWFSLTTVRQDFSHLATRSYYF